MSTRTADGDGSNRVLVFEGPHRLSIQERPMPRPGPSEARVRVAVTGICGSDLHGYTGESGRRVPGMVMGHESSGWVDVLGPHVAGPAPGTPVTFIPAIACGGSCGHGATNRCSELRVIGVTPDLPGAFADTVIVPADRLVAIDGMSHELAATIEPMAVAVQAVRQAGAVEGRRVAVIGGGMIGLCIAVVLRDAGADPVVSEPLAARRAIAESCGLMAVEPASLSDLTPFDCSFDAVGVSATAATAIQSIPEGATTVFVGLGESDITIPLFDVVVAERSVRGSFCYPDEVFEDVVARMRGGELDPGPLIGTIVDLDEAPDAFARLASHELLDTKVLVRVGQDPE